jgi:hypothetical protein
MAVVVVDRETQIKQAQGEAIDPQPRIDEIEPPRDRRGRYAEDNSKPKDDKAIEPKAKDEPKATKVENESDLTDEDFASLTEKQQRTVNKKHRAMKEADEFAEEQYRKARAAERRAEELERKLAERDEKGKPAPVEAKEPDPKDYTNEKGEFDAFKYAKDLAKHAAEEAVKADRKEQEKAQREAAEARSYEDYMKRVKDSAKGIEDWNEVCEGAADMTVSGALTGYIRESDTPAPLLAHLARHPDELERLNALPTIKALSEMAKLEAKLTLPKAEPKEVTPEPAKGKTKPPDPIAPISKGNGDSRKDPRDMSTQDHIEDEYRQAREALIGGTTPFRRPFPWPINC